MAYTRKTYDEYVLWGDWGYGWDEVLTESTRREINERLKEYRENDPRPYKVTIRRIKKEER